jgi:hypothetical protein
MKLVRLIEMCLNKTYIRVLVDKHLCVTFDIKHGLQRGDDLAPILFNLALEYAIRRVQSNQKDLKLNGTHQPLVYTDDFNIHYKENNGIII